LLVDWIRAGAPGPIADEPTVASLELTPSASTLALDQRVPLKATAVFTDGRRRDVTWLVRFDSQDAGVVDVSLEGEAHVIRQGETVARGSFQGHVALAYFAVPYSTPAEPSWYAGRNNAIDDAVMRKLAQLRIEPSPTCDDATFLRRASLDTIGTLPTPDEVREFLADTSPDKRRRLVDRLLDRPEWNDFWALQLADLVQNRKERDHDVRGVKGVRALHGWLRAQLAARRSWDQIARELLTARGPTTLRPEVGYYVVTVGEKEAVQSEVVDSVAQAFLGTRVGCARCHNHPLEKFTQDDFYHFAAFFSRTTLNRQSPDQGPTTLVVGTRHTVNLEKQLDDANRNLSQLRRDNGDAKKIEELEKQITNLKKQIDDALLAPVTAQQPRTGKQLAPQPLDRSKIEIAPGADPREKLAEWIVDRRNEAFSGAMVNRLWKHFFATGLVEPVDDLRATNPPSNPELWKLLVAEFSGSGHDLRHVMRLILNSRTYQLASDTRPSSVHDERFYSHYYPRRLPAEVLIDALSFSTGVSEQFGGYPAGIRAIQVPDSGVDSYFLTLFGRSARTTACACERDNSVTLPQLLHLQNGDGLLAKISSGDGRLLQLLKSQADDRRVVEELFLATLSRLPRTEELDRVLGVASNANNAGGATAVRSPAERQELMADLLWALINTKEYSFGH
ncbi:MAG TPA: DUF1549 domain-containing protein, partial [Pirellulaceae bacterium]|nr:DUF1549 domain-containing protein [Pirellulaceae bacterium]